MATRPENEAGGQLAFRVGSRRYFVPTSKVREISPMIRLARVPHAPPSLLGLANVRGNILPVICVAGLTGQTRSNPTRIIVVESEELVGLAVDAIESVGQAKTGRGGARALHLDQLLESSYRSGSAKRIHARVTKKTGESVHSSALVPLVACRAASQEFAFPLSDVEEVIQFPKQIAYLPDSDPAVIGTTTLRGELLALLSLNVLLGVAGSDDDHSRRIVVVRIGSHLVGLAVDAMRGIVRVSAANIDPVPPVLARGNAEARIQAVCRLDAGDRLISLLATSHLLREEQMEKLLGGDIKSAVAEEEVDEEAEQFLVFRTAGEEFALPIAVIEEVARVPEKLTRLPDAPPFVEGVMNVRGTVVPVIDQSRRFGGASSSGERPRVLIVSLGEIRAGFIVDSVTEILRIPSRLLQPVPDLGSDGARVFGRVASLEERVLLIVSPQELLDRAERDLIAGLKTRNPVRPS